MTCLVCYTWAHTIDDGAGTLDDGTAGAGSRSNYHRDWNRANSSYDLRHNFIASLVYDLPFGNGRRLGANWNQVANALFGGWRLGGILTLRTGRPFSPTVNGNLTNTGTANYPNRLGTGDLPSSERSIDRWFDLSALAVPANYVYGNSARNILFGPAFDSMDVRIGKNFYFGEGLRVEFRCEMFNFTNTPHFGLPATAINQAGVGQIRLAGDPHHIRFGLKPVFYTGPSCFPPAPRGRVCPGANASNSRCVAWKSRPRIKIGRDLAT